MTGFAEKLQKVNIPPMMKFDEGVIPGGRKISAIFVVLVRRLRRPARPRSWASAAAS